MKAVVWRDYGPPEALRLAEVPKPVPRDDEVLIRVTAGTVTAADAMMRRGQSLMGRAVIGLTRPRRRYRIPGLELAGEVESTGRAVSRFRAGDRVFGFTGFHLGAHAAYVCLPERGSLAIKPANITDAEAAALADGASTALYFLADKVHLHAGQKLLVIGAAGSVGSYAVQLARHLGAEVTGTCSAPNAELVRSLGADRVIDHTQENVPDSNSYDVIFDAVGRSSFPRCRNSLSADGCYVTTAVGVAPITRSLTTRLGGGRRVVWGMSVDKTHALRVLADLAERGEIRPVLDRSYPLEQIARAHRYVDQGHKRGNVILTVDEIEPGGRPQR
jgi:NADPH:quinone reductase-like Zn-dependent oxidoreductase